MSQVSTKPPSVMRYDRVEKILNGEPAFASRMSPRNVAVCKPDGNQKFYSPEVVDVTNIIHDLGKDPHKVQKNEVIRTALKVFKIGQAPAPVAAPVNGTHVKPVEPSPAPTPEPVLETKKPEPEKPQKAAPRAVAKAAAKPTQPTPVATLELPPEPVAPPPPAPAHAQAPDAPAPAAPAPAAPAPVAAAPAPAAPAPVAAAPPPQQSREEALDEASKLLNPERPGEDKDVSNAYISMYSLALTILQLIELYDRQPGREKRYKTLDEFAKEINRFTHAKSAKESQKAKS
jgi:hypothetical protein